MTFKITLNFDVQKDWVYNLNFNQRNALVMLEETELNKVRIYMKDRGEVFDWPLVNKALSAIIISAIACLVIGLELSQGSMLAYIGFFSAAFMFLMVLLITFCYLKPRVKKCNEIDGEYDAFIEEVQNEDRKKKDKNNPQFFENIIKNLGKVELNRSSYSYAFIIDKHIQYTYHYDKDYGSSELKQTLMFFSKYVLDGSSSSDKLWLIAVLMQVYRKLLHAKDPAIIGTLFLHFLEKIINQQDSVFIQLFVKLIYPGGLKTKLEDMLYLSKLILSGFSGALKTKDETKKNKTKSCLLLYLKHSLREMSQLSLNFKDQGYLDFIKELHELVIIAEFSDKDQGHKEEILSFFEHTFRLLNKEKSQNPKGMLSDESKALYAFMHQKIKTSLCGFLNDENKDATKFPLCKVASESKLGLVINSSDPLTSDKVKRVTSKDKAINQESESSLAAMGGCGLNHQNQLLGGGCSLPS